MKYLWRALACIVLAIVGCVTAMALWRLVLWSLLMLLLLCTTGCFGFGRVADAIKPPVELERDALTKHTNALEKETASLKKNVGSLEEQRNKIMETRNRLYDLLSETDLKLKQNDRDQAAEKIRHRQIICDWVAGLMFVATLICIVAAVMINVIPKKLTLGGAMTFFLIGLGALVLNVLMPYLVVIAIVVFSGIGLWAVIYFAPRLHALHEIAGVVDADSRGLSEKARQVITKIQAQAANAKTAVFPKK